MSYFNVGLRRPAGVTRDAPADVSTCFSSLRSWFEGYRGYRRQLNSRRLAEPARTDSQMTAIPKLVARALSAGRAHPVLVVTSLVPAAPRYRWNIRASPNGGQLL